MVIRAALAAIGAYLLGNLNGAICVSALLHDDVRKHGSGNAGLTNFIRSYGTGKAILVVLIDVLKAVVACMLGGLLLRADGLWLEGTMLGCIFVMLGHDFPVFLGFKGGKGILSGAVCAYCMDWRIGLIVTAVFLAAYLATGYVSLGSVLGALGFAICFAVFHHDSVFVLGGGIFLGVLTIFMHRENLVRLVKGTERKTNLFKK
ncbi:MAG: glycerol-3-phosphate acyltransferase [Firmicutes bacterium]|nr:glycerol-3-phosphate acyltransferase [Bacillota bacterium]